MKDIKKAGLYRPAFLYIPLCLGFWTFPLSMMFSQHANISFEHFTHDEGISAPVTHVAQDSFGFLWLGTMDGLNRFDGKNFLAYRNNPLDLSTLSNNIINDIYVDNHNRVWAATNGGLCYYNYSDGAFHQVDVDYSLEKIDRHRVMAVTQDPGEGVWFATQTVLHRWRENQTLQSFPLPYADNLIIKCLHADHLDRIWIGTSRGAYVLYPASKKFIYKEITSPFSLEKGLTATVHPIVPYAQDTFLIGSWYGGLQKIFLKGDSLHHIPLIDDVETNPTKHVIKSVCKGPADQWWVGSYGNGLSIFHARRSAFTHHFHHDPSDAHSLGDEYIWDVFTDNSGIVWVATTRGLDKFDPLTQQFSSIPIPSSPGEFSVYRLPSSITEDIHDRTKLWVTVSGVGLFHYNTTDWSHKLYQHEPGNPFSLPDNTIYSVFYDDKGIMWVGMRSDLCLFDPQREIFIPAPLQKDVAPKGVHTLFQDRNKNYWFATHSNGIYFYDPVLKRLTSYSYNPEDPNSLPDNKVFCMKEDRKGHIWIGMQNRGLCRLDPSTGQFIFFEHEKSNPSSLPDNGVYDIYEDREGTLWIASENGFASLDPHQHRFRTYTTMDGLSNNDVFSIVPDPSGNLWLATNNGLSKFDPSTGYFKNYYIHDGLPTNNIRGSLFLGSDGRLFLGTTGMITFCHPEKMKMNQRPPPVIITQFKIFDKEAPILRQGDMVQPIRLSYRQNMITFDFAALNFSNSILNQYAYTLEGFDDQWIYCGHKQSATYTNLNGGTYTFRVKAANNDGVWNEEGTWVTLTVRPPFWRTWWFYLLCIVVIAGLLYTAYRFRINQLLKLQQIRMRISRDLHDDIGSTLSSINMISSMATQTLPPEKKAFDLFQTISTASREAMELMSDIVWSINPKNDRMEMIIIRMRQYASEILEGAQIPFTMDVDDECIHLTLPVEKRKDFYLIFKEAINNLAKYSAATHASIRLQFHARTLTLSISDNGIGFDAEEKYPGNGLKNMKARAMLLSGHITLTSRPAEGTIVALHFPVSP